MMKNSMHVPARKRANGAAAVEFALLLPILLLAVAGIVEFGRFFWYYDVLTKSTRDAVRYMSTVAKADIGTAAGDASAPPYGSGNFLTVKSIAVNAANAARVSPALGSGNVTVNCLDANFAVVACQNNVAPENVRVAVSYNMTLGQFLPLSFFSELDSFTVTLAPGATMRYLN